MTFMQWLSNGGFSKFAWIMMQFILIVGASIVIGIEIINNEPVNQNLWLIVYGVLVHSATVGGGIITTSLNQAQAPTNITVNPGTSTTKIVPATSDEVTGTSITAKVAAV